MTYRLAAWAALPWILVSPAIAQTAAPAAPAERTSGAEEEEVVVVAGRPRGTVPGDATPLVTFNVADIRAQGATSVTELLGNIAAQVGSARGRGGGQPVVLLNGRRISDFREIATIPTEAIARVEVFNEDVALQYGYTADQRVVNMVLRPRFKAASSEANVADLADHSGDRERGQVGYLRLRPEGRLQLDGTYVTQSAVTQLERGISPQSAAIDDRALRTVTPESQTLNLTGVYMRELSKTLAATASLNMQASESAALLGLDPVTGSAARSQTDTTSTRASLALDRSGAKWMGTATFAVQRDDSERAVFRSTSPSRAKSENTLVEAIGTIQGPVSTLPAGTLRMSARTSASFETLDSTSQRSGSTLSDTSDRSDVGARFTLTAPVISPDLKALGALGTVNVNLSGSANALSDFDTVSTIGAGVNWAPLDTLRFAVQGSWGESAPDLRQLGAPAQTTPGAIVFDPRSGQSVTVTTIAGGNPALDAERRDDLTFNATWTPKAIEGLTLTGSYVHNETRDGISEFPELSGVVEAAFPSRFVRDGSGALVSVDRRAINVAERQTDTVRVGLNFSRGFGPRVTPPWGSGPPPWIRGANDAAGAGAAQPADSKPWRPPPGFDPPPPGAHPPGAFSGPSFRGGGGFRNARVGRFSGSVYYTQRLQDEVVLARGVPAIDLIDNAILGGASGAEKIEVEGGATYRGLGFRLNGTWNSDYNLLGAASAQDLSFSDAFTLNARLFMGFDARPNLTREYPLLRGVRLHARVDNIFDEAPDVRDASGATPFAYQNGLLAPQGRVVEFGMRKLF